MAKLIQGMDYSDSNPVQRKYAKEEFQSLMRQTVKDGGFRRAEGGETFVHDKNGFIMYECWSIVPP